MCMCAVGKVCVMSLCVCGMCVRNEVCVLCVWCICYVLRVWKECVLCVLCVYVCIEYCVRRCEVCNVCL